MERGFPKIPGSRGRHGSRSRHVPTTRGCAQRNSHLLSHPSLGSFSTSSSCHLHLLPPPATRPSMVFLSCCPFPSSDHSCAIISSAPRRRHPRPPDHITYAPMHRASKFATCVPATRQASAASIPATIKSSIPRAPRRKFGCVARARSKGRLWPEFGSSRVSDPSEPWKVSSTQPVIDRTPGRPWGTPHSDIRVTSPLTHSP